jgi:nascent polypeptide-associated complex subunit alpha
MDPRQMSMMMKKLGIDVRDIEGVQQVVVRTASKDYVFDKATVSVMKAQGVETWQVSGKPRTVERSSDGPSISASSSSPAPALAPALVAAEPEYVAEPADIALVAQETGKSPAEARAALVATKGDLAEAILRLS